MPACKAGYIMRLPQISELVVEQAHDINYLDLKAILLSLQSCGKAICNAHILIYSDNTTAVVSLNRQGSTQSKNCNDMACQI